MPGAARPRVRSSAGRRGSAQPGARTLGPSDHPFAVTCAGRHNPLAELRTQETNLGRHRPEARGTATRSPRISPAHLPASHPAHGSAFPASGRCARGCPAHPRASAGRFLATRRGGVASPPLGETHRRPERSPSESPPRAGPRRPRALTFQSASAPAPAPAPGTHSSRFRGPGGSPASGRSWGRGQRRAGASSGSVYRGRSSRCALVCERCGLPLPTEVGRGARRRRPGAGRTVRAEPAGGRGACGAKGCLLGWESSRRAPGEGGQPPTPGSSALS